MDNRFNTKILYIILFFSLLILVIPKQSNAQLKYTLEANFGYNLLIANSKVLYEDATYGLFTNYQYFPFGISLVATNSPYVLIDIGINLENRYLNRQTSYQSLNEDFKILFYILKIPIHMRINLPIYDLFIITGFSMNFIIGADFSGTMMRYSPPASDNKNDNYIINRQQNPPSVDDIEVIDIDDPLYTGEDDLLMENFNTSDYTLNLGVGWKYNLNDTFYTIIMIRMEFSIIDIDRSLYYETYLHSFIIMGSFGINL